MVPRWEVGGEHELPRERIRKGERELKEKQDEPQARGRRLMEQGNRGGVRETVGVESSPSLSGLALPAWREGCLR